MFPEKKKQKKKLMLNLKKLTPCYDCYTFNVFLQP